MEDLDFKFTVFTPTYNRSHTLQRVYKSLIRQSFKEFIWLIIDDGSNDNTGELVENWKSEGKINIEYHYKENGGKHTAMHLAYQFAKSKYFTAIDSDDELLPDAIETFNFHWSEIEKQDLENEFAEVSALTIDTKRKLVGNFYFPENLTYIDSNWHEMVLKFRNNNEHIVCWNLRKLIEATSISDKLWLSEKISVLGEAVLWARLGKKYKTRYINKPLRIYHLDGGDSLLRIKDKVKGHYNNLVSNKYFLDENLNYFFWNPKYFFNLILKFIISGIYLKISPFIILREIKTNKFRVAFIVCYPLGFTAWIYFNYIKRQFWF